MFVSYSHNMLNSTLHLFATICLLAASAQILQTHIPGLPFKVLQNPWGWNRRLSTLTIPDPQEVYPMQGISVTSVFASASDLHWMDGWWTPPTLVLWLPTSGGLNFAKWLMLRLRHALIQMTETGAGGVKTRFSQSISKDKFNILQTWRVEVASTKIYKDKPLPTWAVCQNHSKHMENYVNKITTDQSKHEQLKQGPTHTPAWACPPANQNCWNSWQFLPHTRRSRFFSLLRIQGDNGVHKRFFLQRSHWIATALGTEEDECDDCNSTMHTFVRGVSREKDG